MRAACLEVEVPVTRWPAVSKAERATSKAVVFLNASASTPPNHATTRDFNHRQPFWSLRAPGSSRLGGLRSSRPHPM